jgi:hypothetical protein
MNAKTQVLLEKASVPKEDPTIATKFKNAISISNIMKCLCSSSANTWNMLDKKIL